MNQNLKMLIARLLAMAVGLFSCSASANSVTPEVVTSVQLSNTDTNRIVCSNGPMNDVFFSTDKIREVPLSGKFGFIKFPIMKEGNKMKYVEKRAEFHFVCDGLAYTIIASPKSIPAQVIYLGNSVLKRAKENISLMGQMSEEGKGLYLIVNALTKKELSGNFRVAVNKDLTWHRSLIQNADIALVRTIKVDGLGLRLKEYLVKSYRDQYLDERRFVLKELSDSMRQVAVEPLSVKSGQQARVFIVEEATN